MPEFPTSSRDSYLARVEDLLLDLSPRQRNDILRELAAHIEDTAAEGGIGRRQENIQAALMRLGPPEALASAFGQVYRAGHAPFTARRLLDSAIALTMLALCAPLLALCALMIALDSRGAIVFTSERVGRNGRPFRMYKLRSMRRAGDRLQITRVGRVLRRTAVDELPQLVNVLRGEMSLVGPRPCVPDDPCLTMVEWQPVLATTPGLVSLAHGHVTEDGCSERLALELAYLRQRSLMLDLHLLARIVRALIRPHP